MKGKLENKYELDNIEFQMFKDKVVIGSCIPINTIPSTGCSNKTIEVELSIDESSNTYLIKIDNDNYSKNDILEFIVEDILPIKINN